MSLSRIAFRSLLVVTLAISVGVIAFAIRFSTPDSDGGWAAIAGALAVIAAVISAWIGMKGLELQIDTYQPYPFPSVDTTSRYGLLQLCVKNTGGGTAYDIRLFWDKPLLNSTGQLVCASPKEGIPDFGVLHPGENIFRLIDESGKFFTAIQDAIYSGRVQFKDASGKTHTHPFNLDIEAYRKTLYHNPEEPKTHHQLQQIPGKLDALISELKAIREKLPQ